MGSYEYYSKILKNETLPLVALDLDLLTNNIAEIKKRLKSNKKTIRVASKSIRSIDVLRYILNSDPIFDGIMAYSPREVKLLLENDFSNILLAYPSMEKELLLNLYSNPSNSEKLTLMIDSIEHVDLLEEVGKKSGCKIRVCVDIDMSVNYPGIYFGVFRSKIRDVQSLEVLISYILKLQNLKVVGLMGYEAQIAGVPDYSPARSQVLNWIIRRLKHNSIRKIRERRLECVQLVNRMGIELEFVNGGGTGSVESTQEELEVTEVTVGSGFYSPSLFDYYENFKHSPAHFFVLRVTRNPTENIFTCAGGGYIASGSIGIDKQPVPVYPEGVRLIENEGMGEVQTPIRYGGRLKIGDLVFFRHAKAGELNEHFDEIIIISQGKIINQYKTYRGLGTNF